RALRAGAALDLMVGVEGVNHGGLAVVRAGLAGRRRRRPVAVLPAVAGRSNPRSGPSQQDADRERTRDQHRLEASESPNAIAGHSVQGTPASRRAWAMSAA